MGICHRDIRLENILVDSNHKVKIIDFGHATYFVRKEKENEFIDLIGNIGGCGRGSLHGHVEKLNQIEKLLGTNFGSFLYTAPEVFKEGIYYKARPAEMWSLGILLYTMVCGFLPFESSNMDILCQQITEGKYNLPLFLSENCKTLIQNLIQPDLEKRFSLEEIISHKWMNTEFKPDIKPGLNDKRIIIPVDMEVASSVSEQCKLPKEILISYIMANHHNSYTAMYYLTVRKMVRKNKCELLSAFEGVRFEEYLNDISNIVPKQKNNRASPMKVRGSSNNINECKKGTLMKCPETLFREAVAVKVTEKIGKGPWIDEIVLDSHRFALNKAVVQEENHGNEAVKRSLMARNSGEFSSTLGKLNLGKKKRETVLGELVRPNDQGETNLQSKLKFFESKKNTATDISPMNYTGIGSRVSQQLNAFKNKGSSNKASLSVAPNIKIKDVLENGKLEKNEDHRGTVANVETISRSINNKFKGKMSIFPSSEEVIEELEEEAFRKRTSQTSQASKNSNLKVFNNLTSISRKIKSKEGGRESREKGFRDSLQKKDDSLISQEGLKPKDRSRSESKINGSGFYDISEIKEANGSHNFNATEDSKLNRLADINEIGGISSNSKEHSLSKKNSLHSNANKVLKYKKMSLVSNKINSPKKPNKNNSEILSPERRLSRVQANRNKNSLIISEQERMSLHNVFIPKKQSILKELHRLSLKENMFNNTLKSPAEQLENMEIMVQNQRYSMKTVKHSSSVEKCFDKKQSANQELKSLVYSRGSKFKIEPVKTENIIGVKNPIKKKVIDKPTDFFFYNNTTKSEEARKKWSQEILVVDSNYTFQIQCQEVEIKDKHVLEVEGGSSLDIFSKVEQVNKSNLLNRVVTAEIIESEVTMKLDFVNENFLLNNPKNAFKKDNIRKTFQDSLAPPSNASKFGRRSSFQVGNGMNLNLFVKKKSMGGSNNNTNSMSRENSQRNTSSRGNNNNSSSRGNLLKKDSKVKTNTTNMGFKNDNLNSLLDFPVNRKKARSASESSSSSGSKSSSSEKRKEKKNEKSKEKEAKPSTGGNVNPFGGMFTQMIKEAVANRDNDIDEVSDDYKESPKSHIDNSSEKALQKKGKAVAAKVSKKISGKNQNNGEKEKDKKDKKDKLAVQNNKINYKKVESKIKQNISKGTTEDQSKASAQKSSKKKEEASDSKIKKTQKTAIKVVRNNKTNGGKVGEANQVGTSSKDSMGSEDLKEIKSTVESGNSSKKERTKTHMRVFSAGNEIPENTEGKGVKKQIGHNTTNFNKPNSNNNGGINKPTLKNPSNKTKGSFSVKSKISNLKNRQNQDKPLTDNQNSNIESILNTNTTEDSPKNTTKEEEKERDCLKFNTDNNLESHSYVIESGNKKNSTNTLKSKVTFNFKDSPSKENTAFLPMKQKAQSTKAITDTLSVEKKSSKDLKSKSRPSKSLNLDSNRSNNPSIKDSKSSRGSKKNNEQVGKLKLDKAKSKTDSHNENFKNQGYESSNSESGSQADNRSRNSRPTKNTDTYQKKGKDLTNKNLSVTANKKVSRLMTSTNFRHLSIDESRSNDKSSNREGMKMKSGKNIIKGSDNSKRSYNTKVSSSNNKYQLTLNLEDEDGGIYSKVIAGDGQNSNKSKKGNPRIEENNRAFTTTNKASSNRNNGSGAKYKYNFLKSTQYSPQSKYLPQKASQFKVKMYEKLMTKAHGTDHKEREGKNGSENGVSKVKTGSSNMMNLSQSKSLISSTKNQNNNITINYNTTNSYIFNLHNNSNYYKTVDPKMNDKDYHLMSIKEETIPCDLACFFNVEVSELRDRLSQVMYGMKICFLTSANCYHTFRCSTIDVKFDIDIKNCKMVKQLLWISFFRRQGNPATFKEIAQNILKKTVMLGNMDSETERKH